MRTVTLHAPRSVPGLPRLVGLPLLPAAVVTTCHETQDLQTWLCRHFDLDEYLQILLSLSPALYGLFTEGFTHIDVKSDNVIVDERNVPTLIDVGLVSPKNGRPYEHNAKKGRAM